jgi:CheY-like chemotaxis protein
MKPPITLTLVRAVKATGLSAYTSLVAIFAAAIRVSAAAFDEDRRRCQEAGMNGHIGKPVDPDVLFETLLKWLEGAPVSD